VRGTLKPDGTLELMEKPNLPPGPVQVTLQAVQEARPGEPGLLEILDRIHANQRARGYQGLTEEEMAARIAALRDDEVYEERWRQIWSQTAKPPAEEKP
jgi:hypothetical protein